MKLPKFPFVTRSRHDAEIAEEKHATGYMEQRRNYWCDEILERNKKIYFQAREIEILEKNLKETISQRDMASKNYQRIMEDHAQTLIEFRMVEKNYDQAVSEIVDLKQRLAPFERKHGPNGKFVPAQPKESGQ